MTQQGPAMPVPETARLENTLRVVLNTRALLENTTVRIADALTAAEALSFLQDLQEKISSNIARLHAERSESEGAKADTNGDGVGNKKARKRRVDTSSAQNS